METKQDAQKRATGGEQQEPPIKKSKPRAMEDKEEVDFEKPKVETAEGKSSEREKTKERNAVDKVPVRRSPHFYAS